MADNIIQFDLQFRIKRKLPGFGTPGFADAYAEAKGFLLILKCNLEVPERDALTRSEFIHVASKLLSPLGLSVLEELVLRHDLRGENTRP